MAIEKIRLDWDDIRRLIAPIDLVGKKIYGIPRGGLCACASLRNATLVYNNPADADIILDDIVDSGATKARYLKAYPNKEFFALVDKTDGKYYSKWVMFPWENSNSEEDIIIRLLQYIGEDPTRQGLLETPKRVIKAWSEWTRGYNINPASVLKTFEDGAEQLDQMVTVDDIPVWSHCEHHLAPFFGTARISYIPNGKIVGLSKFARLVDVYARRLQVQERLTNQIADALEEVLAPIGIGVEIRCRHLCMESRGVKCANSNTKTIALRGLIKDDNKARNEFLTL